jgi:hypothetical protein
LKDLRQRKMVVVSGDRLGSDLVKGYVDEGFGVVQIPDLKELSGNSADYYLSLIADQVQEFIKDGQQVVVLKDKEDRWCRRFLSKLRRRGLAAEVKSVSE